MVHSYFCCDKTTVIKVRKATLHFAFILNLFFSCEDYLLHTNSAFSLIMIASLRKKHLTSGVASLKTFEERRYLKEFVGIFTSASVYNNQKFGSKHDLGECLMFG